MGARSHCISCGFTHAVCVGGDVVLCWFKPCLVCMVATRWCSPTSPLPTPVLPASVCPPATTTTSPCDEQEEEEEEEEEEGGGGGVE